MPDSWTEMLEGELKRVTEWLTRLENYKAALEAARRAHGELNGIDQRPILFAALTDGDTSEDAPPRTLEMARTVLNNLNGKEATLDEIRALVRKTYGVEPAKSLEQMLYKRAAMPGPSGRKGKTFYKTDEGRFGLVCFRPIIDTVRAPSTATA